MDIFANEILEPDNIKFRFLPCYFCPATLCSQLCLLRFRRMTLYQSRWNLKHDGTRRPRILFLADRNILSDQAYGEFSRYGAFKEDALLRISGLIV